MKQNFDLSRKTPTDVQAASGRLSVRRRRPLGQALGSALSGSLDALEERLSGSSWRGLPRRPGGAKAQAERLRDVLDRDRALFAAHPRPAAGLSGSAQGEVTREPPVAAPSGTVGTSSAAGMNATGVATARPVASLPPPAAAALAAIAARAEVASRLPRRAERDPIADGCEGAAPAPKPPVAQPGPDVTPLTLAVPEPSVLTASEPSAALAVPEPSLELDAAAYIDAAPYVEEAEPEVFAETCEAVAPAGHAEGLATEPEAAAVVAEIVAEVAEAEIVTGSVAIAVDAEIVPEVAVAELASVETEAPPPPLPVETAAASRPVCTEPIRTQTMARLLAAQGYRKRALSIYEHLLARRGDDAALRAEADALRS